MKHPHSETDFAFAKVMSAFADNRNVTYGGGKGFGSKALRVEGKIFSMISSKGDFVVKLPRKRVDELVQLKIGEYFNTGGTRLMKEWIAISGNHSSWLNLATEAYYFVSGIR